MAPHFDDLLHTLTHLDTETCIRISDLCTSATQAVTTLIDHFALRPPAAACEGFKELICLRVKQMRNGQSSTGTELYTLDHINSMWLRSPCASTSGTGPSLEHECTSPSHEGSYGSPASQLHVRVGGCAFLDSFMLTAKCTTARDTLDAIFRDVPLAMPPSEDTIPDFSYWLNNAQRLQQVHDSVRNRPGHPMEVIESANGWQTAIAFVLSLAPSTGHSR